MSTPADAFHEARERHEAAGEHAPRWIPVAAAFLAVCAAISGFVASTRSSQALVAKSEEIVATTRANDAYSEYSSRSIRQHIYEAAAAANPNGNVRALRRVAAHESAAKGPLLEKAHALEESAKAENERSERLLVSHEIVEFASTLFEIAIVLVSLTALVGSRVMPLTAGVAAAIGIVVFFVGVLRR